MEKEALGKKIREVRREKGYSRQVLAEMANTGAVYLGEIERGLKMPSLNSFIKVIEALEVTADYILRDELTSGKYIKTALAVGLIKPDLQPSFKLRRRRFLKMLYLVLANPKTCRLKKVVVFLTLVNIRFAYILTKKYFPECLHLEMRET